MKDFTQLFKFKAIALFALLFFVAPQAEASHFRYGNVSWTVISNSGSSTVVEFTVTASYYYGAGSQFTAWGSIPVGGTINTVDDFIFGQGSAIRNDLIYTVTSKNNNESWLVASCTFRYTYTTLTNFQAYMRGVARIGTLQFPNNSLNLEYYIRTVVSLSNPSNDPPSASTPPIFYVPINQSAYNIQINATDPEGFPLTFSWAPAGATTTGLNSTAPTLNGPAVLNPSTGQITVNTNGLTAGRQYAAQVYVTDNAGARVAVDFIIQTVSQSNPPVFDYSTGNTPSNGSVIKVQPGQTVNFKVKASDVDAGSTVTLSSIGMPVGATLSPAINTGNPITQTFNWVTSIANLGSRTITFSAVDNFFTQTTTSVTIIVTLAPVFDVPPTPAIGSHIVVAPGTPVSFAVQARDPDPNDVCRIVAINGKDMGGNKIPIYAGVTTTPALPTAPSNVTSLQFNWTPSVAQWGHRHVFFTAEDGYNDKTDHEVSILVNTVPNFTSIPVTSVYSNQLFTYNITVNDPDVLQGDVLTILSQSLPSWLTLTNNGGGMATLSGTPTIADAGTVNIKLIAEDTYHHDSPIPTQEFVITVIPCDFSISGTATDVECNGGSDGAIDITLTGVYGTPTFAWTGPDNFTSSNEDISGLAAGSYTVLVSSNLGCIETETFVVGTTPDVIPPTITCPSNIITGNDPGICGAVVNYVVNSTDNCGATASLLTGLPSGSVFPVGTTTVKWRTVENSGKSVTYNFENLNIGALNGQDNWKVVGAGTNPPNANVNQVLNRPTSGAYTGSKAFFAADVGGNNRTFSSRINNSNFSFPPVQNTDIVVLEYDNDRSYWGNALEVGFDANNDGDLDETGERTFGVLEATNGNVLSIYGFNSATLASISNVTGGDWRRLRLTVDLEANGGAGSISLSYRDLTNNGSWVSPAGLQNINAGLNPLATNGQNASKINGMRYFHEAGETSYLDNISFTTKSSATCSFTVTVNDTEAPVINCSADIVAANDPGACGAAVVYNVTSSDNCSGQTVEQTAGLESGSVFPVGTTTNTFVVTDDAGNTATCSFTITVNDTEAPVTIAQNVIVQLDASGNGSTTAELVNNGSTDNCGISSVILSQTQFSCDNVGDNTVTLTVTDNSGNVGTTTATVTVKDEVPPVAIAQNVIVQLDNTGNGSTTAALIDNGSNDACGILSMELSRTDFTCADISTNPNIVTLTVTDNHGNINTATAEVTVKDEVPANVITKNITIQLDATGNVSITADQVDNGSTDACGIATMSVSPNAFTCSNVGNNTVTLTATDVNGNVSSQTAVVNVEDKILPTWVTTAGSLNSFVSCGNAGTLAAAMTLEPTATDNCSVTINKTTGVLTGNTITNTWSATDINGNTSSTFFTQVITINAVTIDASLSSTPVALGSTATLYAQVTPAEAGISVTFKLDQGGAYGSYNSYTVTTNASGIATQTVTGLTVEVYRVYAIAGDDCANSTAYLAVYDPSAGFVTGGGWITSPLGAYIANPELTGKANFGFVSKYKKGSNVPVGNTEFQFHAGNLNFSSSSYNAGSLVIAGKQAIYKGVGTINGVGGYSFMVSAVDGQVSGGGGIDKFRIKIWNTATGAIVYDNNIASADNATPTTVLGGGSIVIHEASTKSAEIATAIEPEVRISELKAYPNPFSDKLFFEFSREEDTKATLILFDGVGRKISVLFEQQIQGNQNYRIEYVPNGLSTNMLFYRMIFDNEVINGKVIYKK